MGNVDMPLAVVLPELGDLALLLESQGHNKVCESRETKPQDTLAELTKHCCEPARAALVRVCSLFPNQVSGQKADGIARIHLPA